MRAADQFLAGKSADLGELVVAVRDDPAGIGGGNEVLFCWETAFAAAEWLIDSHGGSHLNDRHIDSLGGSGSSRLCKLIV